MTHEQPVAVETSIGTLDFRRETIIVERMEWTVRTLSIECSIDDRRLRVDRGEPRDLTATITFVGVVSLFHAELDTYEAMSDQMYVKAPGGVSNLELIQGSRYERDLPTRPSRGSVSHFRLWTYDDVFDVLATSVDVVVREPILTRG